MVIFPATLLFIVVLALGVLAFVALAAAAERGGDQTRLSQRLRTVMTHLNGQAEPPPAIAAMLTPAPGRRRTQQPAQLAPVEQSPVVQAPVAEPAKTVKEPATIDAGQPQVLAPSDELAA